MKITKLIKVINHGLVHQKKQMHRIIKFKQETLLKSCIGMNIEPGKYQKNDSKKDFLLLTNNAVSKKVMENGRKHRYIKLVTTKGRRNYLISEPNYHTTNFFS